VRKPIHEAMVGPPTPSPPTAQGDTPALRLTAIPARPDGAGHDYRGLADDPLEHDPAAGTITAGRTELQQAIAAIVARAVIENGIDYGAGSSDAVSVHSETIGYQIIDALREHSLLT
jgi:hypothetical protein